METLDKLQATRARDSAFVALGNLQGVHDVLLKIFEGQTRPAPVLLVQIRFAWEKVGNLLEWLEEEASEALPYAHPVPPEGDHCA